VRRIAPLLSSSARSDDMLSSGEEDTANSTPENSIIMPKREMYAMKKVKMGKLTNKEKQNALNEVRILASI
jgi:hypothetical protein